MTSCGRPARPEAERPAARRIGEPRLARRAPRRPDAGRPPRPAGARRRRLHRPLPARQPRAPGRREAVPGLRAHARSTTALDEARGHLIGLTGCRNGVVPRLLLAGERAAALQAARTWARALRRRRLRHRAEPSPRSRRRLARRGARRAGRARRPADGRDERGPLRRSRRASAPGRARLHQPRCDARGGARAAAAERRVPAQDRRRAGEQSVQGSVRTRAAVAPGRRAWRAARPSARPAGWSSASSAIGFRGSPCRRGRPRSHTSTSLPTRAYCAVTARLPSAR